MAWSQGRVSVTQIQEKCVCVGASLGPRTDDPHLLRKPVRLKRHLWGARTCVAPLATREASPPH